jgi:transposase-like protein
VCREHQLKDTVLSRWKREFIERSPQVFEGGCLTSEFVGEQVV